LAKKEAVSSNSRASTAAVSPPCKMGSFGTIATEHQKSNEKVPREHEDDVQFIVDQSFQRSSGDSIPSVSGVAMTTPVSPSKPLSNLLFADAQNVMDSPVIDFQDCKQMHWQSSSRSSCTLKASVWTFATTQTVVIFIALFCPIVAVAHLCSRSSNTAAPCTGPFHIGTHPFPMLDTAEGCCACADVKCSTMASLQAHQPSANNHSPPDSVYGEMPLYNFKR